MREELYATLTAEQTVNATIAIAKGDKGDKGDNGDAYVITEADKQEIKDSLSGDISELKGDLDEFRFMQIPKKVGGGLEDYGTFYSGRILEDGTFQNKELLMESSNTNQIIVEKIDKECHLTAGGTYGIKAVYYDVVTNTKTKAVKITGGSSVDNVIITPDNGSYIVLGITLSSPTNLSGAKEIISLQAYAPESINISLADDSVDYSKLSNDCKTQINTSIDNAISPITKKIANVNDILSVKEVDEDGYPTQYEYVSTKQKDKVYGEGGLKSTAYNSLVGGADMLSEPFNFSNNWYAEMVMVGSRTRDTRIFSIERDDANGNYNACYLRDLGKLQFGVEANNTIDGVYKYADFGYYPKFGTDFAHVMIIKQNGKLSMYVDGSLHKECDFSVDYKNSTKYWSTVVVGALHQFKLFRLGYFTEDVNELVSKHYNHGNPFGYDDSNSFGRLVEFLPEKMTTTEVTNTANNVSVSYRYSDISVIEENPWKNIEGSGSPSVIPVYVGQKYTDTDTDKIYTAVGISSVSDWSAPASTSDIAKLKTQTKTVNGQSIWGTGDIAVGGSGDASVFVSVRDKGAIGDGETDDTEAIIDALEYARANGKALYFPVGTYLTRKGLVLTDNMRITGEPNAVLKSASAVLDGGGHTLQTYLTANASAGDTVITVANTAGLVVGQEITIGSVSYGASYMETFADIVAVDGNDITIDTSRFTADGSNSGLRNATSSGTSSYVLTDFSLIKTVMTKSAENIIVENITLEPCSNMDEPHIYTISPISQTRQMPNAPQKNFRVYNVTVLESAHDGISVQGSGEIEVIGCRVYNQKHKGIHWGTSCDMVRVENNYVYGCGSARYEDFSDYQGSGAMFFCSNNHRVIITGNHIENCYKGIYGFNYQGNGEVDSDTVIANNTFKNCTLYGLMLRGGLRAVVNGNNFVGFKGTATPIYVEQDSGFPLRASVISNNTIGGFDENYSGTHAIHITGAKDLVISGNVISGLYDKSAIQKNIVDTSPNCCDIVVTGSEKVMISGNVTDGSINVSDSGNVNCVKANNIETA